MTTQAAAGALGKLRELSLLAGGPLRTRRQRDAGKLLARERVELLLDAGTFVELDALARRQDAPSDEERPLGDGVVTGWGRIDGRIVYVFAHDFTVLGGSLGHMHANKICKVMDLAMRNGAPVVGLNDSGGGRIQEGVASLAGYTEIFRRNTLASGVIPQISAILGSCAGGAAYAPALTDFVLMTRERSHMFVTGPEVVATVTGEAMDAERLGGSRVHAERSGAAHLVAEDDEDALFLVRRLLSYLPQNQAQLTPRVQPRPPPDAVAAELDGLVPEGPNVAYDVREAVRRIVDVESFLELQPDFAPNIVVGFARLDGHAVGVVANQPRVLAGAIDCAAATKAARFVRCCDSFNVPILTFVDVPGFLPGVEQEARGILRDGAKLLYAYCEAVVPRLTVILRKAYGGGYAVMSSKHTGADYNVAWPTAEIAVMGSQSAVNVLHRRTLAQPGGAALRRDLEQEYHERFAHPYDAASRGYVDEVVLPRETRGRLVSALHACLQRGPQARGHGNIPL